MKEKNKKFMKALGVGAVATLGLFTMSGCSINLTEEQIDKVMYAVDNSDKFMKDSLALLENQNAKLNLEEAWNKLELAKAKFETNYNGMRNNFRFTMIQEIDGALRTQTLECLQTSNNGYVSNCEITTKEGDNETYSTELFYENDGKVHSYKKLDRTATRYSKVVLEDYKSSEACAHIENLIEQCIPFEEKEENFNVVEVLENGNFKMTLVYKFDIDDRDENNPYFHSQTGVVEYILTPDCKLVSIGINLFTANDSTHESDRNVSVNNISLDVKIEYNVVSKTSIDRLLQEANSKELKAEE